MPIVAIIFGFLFVLALRIGFLLLAAWVMVLNVPTLLADPDHFSAWLWVLVALSIAVSPASTSFTRK